MCHKLAIERQSRRRLADAISNSHKETVPRSRSVKAVSVDQNIVKGSRGTDHGNPDWQSIP